MHELSGNLIALKQELDEVELKVSRHTLRIASVRRGEH